MKDFLSSIRLAAAVMLEPPAIGLCFVDSNCRGCRQGDRKPKKCPGLGPGQNNTFYVT
jgi:hypothetical protein